MNQESIVYGCIKGVTCNTDDELKEANLVNQSVIAQLPVLDDWPFLTRDMFSMTRHRASLNTSTANLIHFGASYSGIEYEWNLWMEKFEHVLQAMYWQSAAVHLETELSGVHTFIWETDGLIHKPHSESINVRCEWNHELVG